MTTAIAPAADVVIRQNLSEHLATTDVHICIGQYNYRDDVRNRTVEVTGANNHDRLFYQADIFAARHFGKDVVIPDNKADELKLLKEIERVAKFTMKQKAQEILGALRGNSLEGSGPESLSDILTDGTRVTVSGEKKPIGVPMETLFLMRGDSAAKLGLAGWTAGLSKGGNRVTLLSPDGSYVIYAEVKDPLIRKESGMVSVHYFDPRIDGLKLQRKERLCEGAKLDGEVGMALARRVVSAASSIHDLSLKP